MVLAIPNMPCSTKCLPTMSSFSRQRLLKGEGTYRLQVVVGDETVLEFFAESIVESGNFFAFYFQFFR